MNKDSIEAQKIYEKYLGDDMKRLRKISNNIIYKLGEPYTDMCIEDFYEIALIELMKIVIRYDEEKCDHFEPYLILCLRSKFKSLRYKLYGSNKTADVYGRKRIPLSVCISLEAPISEDEEDGGLLIKDVISGKTDIFDEVTEHEEEDLVIIFRKKLSKIENKIIDLLIEGFKANEIQKQLHISSVSYNNHWENIERYKYILKGKYKL